MMVKTYPVPESFAAGAVVKEVEYKAMYEESVRDPDAFWARIAKRIDWMRFPTKIRNVSYDPDDFRIRWFEDGELNVSVNCLDRQLATRGDKTALLFEGDDPSVSYAVTYRELYERVCRFANALRAQGVAKGDVVTIYMPMIPEAAVAMLACARIGAIHSIVFGGFSPDSLAGRIRDCDSNLIITADEGVRGGKKIPLKANVDAALAKHDLPSVKKVVVVRYTKTPINWVEGRDVWYEDIIAGQPTECEPERMNAEDPLFILYTSGSTGQPKGVLHTTGGYLVYANFTFSTVFDYHEDDIFWCTADVGWVTGHSYVVYGPLSAGATSADVRRRAQLSEHEPLLGGGRQAQGNDLLHRANGDPRADARRRRAGEEMLAQEPAGCWARSASRSIPRPGSGTTTWSATSAARSWTPGGRPRPAAS